MLFNLDFGSNTILSFFFFLIIDLNFLIPAVIAQGFNPIAELVFPIGISSKEAKTEIETYPVTAEAKIRKCSIWFRVVQTFLCFSPIHHKIGQNWFSTQLKK